jgi:transcriptional regulator with XRE-family HTH domain
MPKSKPDERRVALGGNIKKLREKRRWSQEELAEKADIHVSYVGQIERGMRYPSLKILFRLSDALEVKITVLFKGTDAGKEAR